jgi:hypothetical protein
LDLGNHTFLSVLGVFDGYFHHIAYGYGVSTGKPLYSELPFDATGDEFPLGIFYVIPASR